MARTAISQQQIQASLLGYAEITTTGTSTDVTGNGTSIGLSVTVNIPVLPTGRRVKITFYTPAAYNNTAGHFARTVLWQGAIGTGTQLRFSQNKMAAATTDAALTMIHFTPANPTPGNVTFNLALSAVTSGTATVYAGALTGATPLNGSAYLAVEIV